MAFISNISVTGLFGLYDHSIDLRNRPRLTIIAGPNGVGKTTLLSLTQALLTGNYRRVVKHEFARLVVKFQNGAEVSAEHVETPNEHDEDDLQLRLKLRAASGAVEEAVVSIPSLTSELSLPPYVEQRGPESFFDSRVGERISLEEAHARYGRHRGRPKASIQPQIAWQEQEEWRVDFIETKRLDSLILSEARHQRHPRRRESETAPIHTYLRAVSRTLETARIDSTRLRQRRDRNFVRRLLETKASRATVSEPQLKDRYLKIEKEAQRLANDGLLTDSLDILPDAGLNPTEKRVIKLFLDDFEAKLKPLRPISAKVEHLRGMIDSKFINKSIQIDPVDGVFFRLEESGQSIGPEALSSGEQHQLALISRLLFTEHKGTTVLIDEPELSLHVSWQHEMIEDLIQISKVADLSFVLATHSTAIINGRWELVDELGPLVEDGGR